MAPLVSLYTSGPHEDARVEGEGTGEAGEERAREVRLQRIGKGGGPHLFEICFLQSK